MFFLSDIIHSGESLSVKKDTRMPVQGKFTVKPILSGHSKIDKTKVLMANGSLMKVKRIADSAILLTCIKR